MQQTVSTKPYLIRALHEWCSDQGYTPYLVVAVRCKMQVPMEYVKDGEIVLNIGYNATRNLTLGNDYITFSARFNGVSREIVIPVGAVVSIFAKESGDGMGFDYEESQDLDAADHAETTPVSLKPEPEPPQPGGGRSHLRVVK